MVLPNTFQDVPIRKGTSGLTVQKIILIFAKTFGTIGIGIRPFAMFFSVPPFANIPIPIGIG